MPLRKLPQGFGHCLPPVLLYLDDVQEIYDLFVKACGGQVVLKASTVEVDTPDELQQLDEPRLHSLEIIGRGGLWLNVGLNDCVWLHAPEDLSARGAMESARDLLARRRRCAAALGGWKSITLGMLLLTASGVMWPLSLVTGRLWWAWLLAPLLWLPGFIMTMFWIRLLGRRSLVVLARRRDAPSFFNRNKDQLLVAALSGSTGAIVGAVAGAVLRGLVGCGGRG